MSSILQDSPTDRRAAIEFDARSIMERAVTHVKIYHPFYGALIHKLKVKMDWRHPSLYCDAVVLGYNPEWVVKARWEQLLYVLVHCVQHCALRHPFRRGKRDEKLYNEAADNVVNLSLQGDESLARSMPTEGTHEYCGPCDARFKGLAVEQVYSILQSEQPPKNEQPEDEDKSDMVAGTSKEAAGDCADAGASGEPLQDEEEEDEQKEEGDEQQESSDQQGDGSSDEEPEVEDEPEAEGDGEEEMEEEPSDEPGEQPETQGQRDDDRPSEGQLPEGGAVVPDQADLEQLEREWGEAVQTAALAAGDDIPDAIRRALGEASKVRQSFDEYIDEFCAKVFSDAESWKRPNRRFSDVYLPSRSAPVVRKLLIGVDTSGSISDEVLRKFEIAAQRIADDFACALEVVYIDTRIRSEEQFPVGARVAFENVKGGGGTNFTPAFKRYKEREDEGEDIAGVIYLTDLEGHVDGWQQYMEIPTLWVSTTDNLEDLWYGQPQFGTVCNIHD